MRWTELLEQQPRLGAVTHDRLVAPGVLLVVTIRRDGTPRLSAVEPFVLDGELWLCMMLDSRKAADLLRDPRVLLHSIITDREAPGGEVKLRGAARAVDDPDTHRRFAGEVPKVLPWSPQVGRFHLFRVDVEQVTFIHYNDDGDQHLVLWPPGHEQVRRSTSATSVGEPTVVHELLV